MPSKEGLLQCTHAASKTAELANNCLAAGLPRATWHPIPTRTTELADSRRRCSRCAEPAAAPGRTRHLAAQHAAQQAAQRVENRVLGRAAELARPQGRKPRDRCQGLRLLRAPAGERLGRHLCGVPSCAASQHRRSGGGPPRALGSQDGLCHAAARAPASCLVQDAVPKNLWSQQTFCFWKQSISSAGPRHPSHSPTTTVRVPAHCPTTSGSLPHGTRADVRGPLCLCLQLLAPGSSASKGEAVPCSHREKRVFGAGLSACCPCGPLLRLLLLPPCGGDDLPHTPSKHCP